MKHGFFLSFQLNTHNIMPTRSSSSLSDRLSFVFFAGLSHFWLSSVNPAPSSCNSTAKHTHNVQKWHWYCIVASTTVPNTAMPSVTSQYSCKQQTSNKINYHITNKKTPTPSARMIVTLNSLPVAYLRLYMFTYLLNRNYVYN